MAFRTYFSNKSLGAVHTLEAAKDLAEHDHYDHGPGGPLKWEELRTDDLWAGVPVSGVQCYFVKHEDQPVRQG